MRASVQHTLPAAASGMPTCDLYADYICVYPLLYSGVSCNCPQACHVTQYEVQLSSAKIAPSFTSYVSQNVSLGTISEQQLHENYATFILYSPTLSYTQLTSEPAYDVIDYFCDMGGALGLLLGSTFFTLYEFADFFIWALLERRKLSKVKS